MRKLLSRSAILVSGLMFAGLGTPVLAGDVADADVSASVSGTADGAGQGPELAAIDYKLLYRRLMQLGMLSQKLGYTLTVGADGKPTDCEFSRPIKSAYTRKRLCMAFIETITFQPARDVAGEPLVGAYQGEIEIASFFQPSR